VYTDWLLIRRLAFELNRGFAGARVRDVGRLEDGRFALQVWSRGQSSLLCIDVFAPTPIVTVEHGELPVAAEPGFVRAAGAALRGTTLTGVRSRLHDRLLRLDFGTRSRFGVEDGYSLVCELVPRFGNVVLLKGETVVAAAKEFGPNENAVRSVQAGALYEPPPLRKGKASPVLDEAAAARLAESPPEGDLHVYRHDGTLVQAHLEELPQFAELQHERSPSLLEVLAEARLRDANIHQSDRVAIRRRSLERTLSERERKLRAELAQVEERLQRSARRESLREEGDAIYARLHELPEARRDEAKERAASLFARYKKEAVSVQHLQRRRDDLAQQLADVDSLAWELQRSGDAHLDDLEQALEGGDRRASRGSKAPSRRRKPLQYRTGHGSRIYVGRTPLENAEVTFRLARPNDLWFHVQNQPGAHVVLQHDGKAQPPEEDILTAAALAALHSKAKNSPKVTVDYTMRKHVRKRPAAAPGLVFYTNPKSVRVAPRAPEEHSSVN
jgi:predicted ribosome quality control (RQC) complex YloA/Tae2 family protein